MNFTTLSGDLYLWDKLAPWYERWLKRTHYYRNIIADIAQMIEPGWEVLDIGAGTGILSIAMASLGAKRVVALEPSEGMRAILKEKLNLLNVKNVEINSSIWEDFEPARGEKFDLIISSNTLHLTLGGIKGGMLKVFSMPGDYICLITEINQELFIDFKEIDQLQRTYAFLYIKKFNVDSSFFFEDMHEVEELEHIINKEIHVELENKKPVQHDSTDVAVLWWEKKS
jgi:ubiquinone/menaquinone biosynthesis C-methylase UbiE